MFAKSTRRGLGAFVLSVFVACGRPGGIVLDDSTFDERAMPPAPSGGATGPTNETTPNTAPIAVTAEVTTVEDTPISAQLAASDSDGNALTYTLVAQPAHGTLAVSAEGVASYTPMANYFGDDVFTFTASDGALESAIATITIHVTPVNDPPFAVSNGALATTMDTPIEITTAAFTIMDVDSATFSVNVAAGANYSVSGAVVTPASGFVGMLSVPVQISDGSALSGIVEVIIDVQNQTPVISAQASAPVIDEDTSLALSLGDLSYSDPDSVPPVLQLVVLAGPNYTVDADGATVHPATNFFGTLSVNVQLDDSYSQSAVFAFQVTVTNVNDAPVIAPSGQVFTDIDTAVTLTTNNVAITDVDGDTNFTLTIGAGANYGVSGAVVTPGVGFIGQLHVPVTVQDPSAAPSNSVDVLVNVANTPPAITGQTQTELVMDEDTELRILASDVVISDPNPGQSFTVTVTAGDHYAVVAGPSGNVDTIKPDADYFGPLSVSLVVNDGFANSAPFATFNVRVVNTPDAPVISLNGALVFGTALNTPITFDQDSVIWSDVDLEPAEIPSAVYALVAGTGANYSLTGEDTVQPATGYQGDLFVPVQLRDPDGGLLSNTITLTVTVANSTPILVGQNPPVPTLLEDAGFFTVDEAMLVINDDPGQAHSVAIEPGSYVVGPSGNSVRPLANAFGVLTVRLSVSDPLGAASNTIDFFIDVTSVNDAPSIAAAGAVTGRIVGSDYTLTTDNIAIDDSLDGASGNTGGTLVVETSGSNYSLPGGSGTTTVRLAPGFVGTINVPVHFVDLESAVSNSVTIAITTQNATPTLIAPSGPVLSVQEDGQLQILPGYLAFTDGGDIGQSYHAEVLADGSNYALRTTTTANDSVAPPTNSTTALSVRVRVCDDASACSNEISLPVNVTPVNDAPIVTTVTRRDIGVGATTGIFTSDLVIVDEPGDTHTLSVNQASGPHYTRASPTSITAEAGYVGDIDVAVTVLDSGAPTGSTGAVVWLRTVNSTPILVGLSGAVTITEDTPRAIGLTGLTFTDGEDIGQPYRIQADPGANYAISGSDTATLTITPALNYAGPLSVPMRVCDNIVCSATVNVSISMISVNDAPVAPSGITGRTTGNVQLTGSIAGMYDVDGPPGPSGTAGPTGVTGIPTLVPVTNGATDTAGGLVTILANGSFTYLPPVGFTGTDGFNFTVEDGLGLRTTNHVSITVAARVTWFVDQSYVGPPAGDGRSSRPFTTLEAASVSLTGQDIELRAGTYAPPSSFTLKDDQRLYGVGVPTITGVSGRTSVIMRNRDVIEDLRFNLGSAIGSTGPIAAVEITDVSITAQSGGIVISQVANTSAADHVVVRNVDVTTAGGPALSVLSATLGPRDGSLDLNGVSLTSQGGAGLVTVGLESLANPGPFGASGASGVTGLTGNTVTGGNGAPAFSLTNTSATTGLNFGRVTHTGNAANALLLDGVTGNFTIGAVAITGPTTAGALVVRNCNALTTNLGTVSIAPTTGNVLVFTSNTTTDTTLTMDRDITSTSGRGVVYSSGGIVRMGNTAALGHAPHVTATSGAALDIDGTNGGVGWVFGNVSATNAGSFGVRFANAGTSDLTTGPVLVTSATTAMLVSTIAGDVSLGSLTTTGTITTGLRVANMSGGTFGINASGPTGVTSGGIIANATGNAVEFVGARSVTLRGLAIDSPLNSGIFVQDNTTLSDFTFEYGRVLSAGNQPFENAFHFGTGGAQLAGTSTIRNAVVRALNDNAIQLETGSAATLNIQQSTINIDGSASALVVRQNAGALTLNVTGVSVVAGANAPDATGSGFNIGAQSTGTITTTLSGNMLRTQVLNTTTVSNGGDAIVLSAVASGRLYATVDTSTIEGWLRGVSLVSLGQTSWLSAVVDNNDIGTTGSNRTYSDGVYVLVEPSTDTGQTSYAAVRISNNDIASIAGNAITAVSRHNAGQLTALVRNNNVFAPLLNMSPFLFATNAIELVATNTSALCADLSNNTVAAPVTGYGFRLREASSGTMTLQNATQVAPVALINSLNFGAGAQVGEISVDPTIVASDVVTACSCAPIGTCP